MTGARVRPFEAVLVANRGEIAVRIIRTLRTLGIRAVAVHSDADATARHVRDADASVRIGSAPASDSYLRVDRIVEAAIASGAQAVHPGYGFLSERAELAAACAAAGLVFVGPPPSAIEAMGDKIRAKATVTAAGVRVVPGAGRAGMSDDELAGAAETIGFPVLIKPSAGGGGKGMRLVEAPERLRAELAAARREAVGAFGDGTLLVERYVARPRHIEVQVLADAHGAVVHLGERECSLQRRHQKIVEEAPSPFLDDDRRAELGRQAVAAARSVGYVNAGTVEFIVDGTDPSAGFFMEMNTRLQVEHPVTELVWGLDLVEWQLRIAAGERLPWTQDELRPSGHAIEARIYAEDPRSGFLPSAGRVLVASEPAGDGVRVDSALEPGLEVGTTYDPMLAKVIAHASTRADALARLGQALADTTILGVTTGTGFIRRLLEDPDVVAGRRDTGLVERVAPAVAPTAPPADAVLAAALSCIAAPPERDAPADPWSLGDGWRVGEPAWTDWTAHGPGGDVRVDLRRTGGSRWCHRERAGDDRGGDRRPGDARDAGDAGDASDAVEVAWLDGSTLRVGAQTWRVARAGGAVWVGREGDAWRFDLPVRRGPSGVLRPDAGTGEVISPMPGVVVAVHRAVGGPVRAGEAVVSVEAMKMEHAVAAPFGGTVASIPVAVGQRVGLGEVLATVARGPADPDVETARRSEEP